MAPTEILAQQHFSGLASLLEPLGIRCAVLTGSARARQRREVVNRIADGTVDFVIGTHALLSRDVAFHNLGLVVTDEQHRFGVAQRAALSEKGRSPHMLVMSATPIPRTLALILYGDLDISVLDELPPGRQPVDTFAVSSAYHPRIYQFLRNFIAQGRQAYIVCPTVDENGDLSDERKAVKTYAQHLQSEIFPDLNIACIHGKMSAREKDAVMSSFVSGTTDILVATSVIEVGVDVPNAVVIVIENAERFGLSQLHQLRGRVGRGSWKSYCILISDHQNEETCQRLKIMTQTGDGFKIAEEDLRLRGPGDFFGERQHGLPDLKISTLGCDTRLAQEAQLAAEEWLAQDPDLVRSPATRARITELFHQNANAMN
jgi:ATP-dependent DNA helicase RecG